MAFSIENVVFVKPFEMMANVSKHINIIYTVLKNEIHTDEVHVSSNKY